MSDTSNNNGGSDEACPADLPEDGGASETSPTVHAQTPSGTTIRVDTAGARPTH